jgi:hypothetical protein
MESLILGTLIEIRKRLNLRHNKNLTHISFIQEKNHVRMVRDTVQTLSSLI